PSPEKIKTIHDLVAAATGFTETRGDQLTVETLPFESTLGVEAPADVLPPAPPAGSLPPGLEKYIQKMPLGMRIGAGVAGVLIVIGPILLLTMRKRKTKKAAASTERSIEGGVDASANFEGQLANR